MRIDVRSCLGYTRLAVATICITATPLAAQQATVISGTVEDASTGATIPGVSVSLVGTQLGAKPLKPESSRNSVAGIFVYSGISPFGYNGAFYYARLSVGL